MQADHSESPVLFNESRERERGGIESKKRGKKERDGDRDRRLTFV